MRKVLLPVDGSRHALQAAYYLADFARQHGPFEAHVVNVEPKPQSWQTHGMEMAAIEEHLKARAVNSIGPAMKLLGEAGVTCHAHFEMGEIAQTVLSLCDSLGCDAIVMGTRGLGGIAGLALGSVAQKILHHAKVPVTCINNGY